MRVRIVGFSGSSGYCMFIPSTHVGNYWKHTEQIKDLVAPVASGRAKTLITKENLPAAIAILRFNGIEVEVEK